MGKYTVTNFAGSKPVFNLENTKVSTGGFLADKTNLLGVTTVYRGAPIEANYATGIAKVLKTATVITGGTTSAPRIAKGHLFIAGEFLAKTVGAVSVTISSIDTSNTDYDVFTLSGAVTGLVADDTLFQATNAGSNAVFYATPNMFLYNDLVVESGDLTGVIFSLEIKESHLPYPINAEIKTSVGYLFTFI